MRVEDTDTVIAKRGVDLKLETTQLRHRLLELLSARRGLNTCQLQYATDYWSCCDALGCW
jgi:hypothetical protein